jgi:hypothetical protein
MNFGTENLHVMTLINYELRKIRYSESLSVNHGINETLPISPIFTSDYGKIRSISC